MVTNCVPTPIDSRHTTTSSHLPALDIRSFPLRVSASPFMLQFSTSGDGGTIDGERLDCIIASTIAKHRLDAEHERRRQSQQRIANAAAFSAML
jgi:hypothetical protein